MLLDKVEVYSDMLQGTECRVQYIQAFQGRGQGGNCLGAGGGERVAGDKWNILGDEAGVHV